MKNTKKDGLNPFVVAVEETRMPMIFVDAEMENFPVIYANDSFLKLMRFSETELIGKPFASIITNVVGGSPIILKDSDDETSHAINYVKAIRSDGETFSAALLVAPISRVSGVVDRYFISLVDISNQIEIGQDQQARLQEVYALTPGFIATTVGPDHRITFANMAYRKLVGPRDLIGLSVADAFPELADQGFGEMLDNVYQTKRPFSGRKVAIDLVRTADGPRERRFIDFIYQPVVDSSGVVTGLFCEGYDVTDFKTKEVRLKVLEARIVELGRLNAMGTMAATLAHELNQPLTAISNYAAGCSIILAESGLENSQMSQGLQAIAAGSDRAGLIIRRVRDMTKRTTAGNDLFDLNQSATDAIELMKAGNHCTINLSKDSSAMSRVYGDRIQVQQVMVNLLRNACEAAEHNGAGTVTVSIENSRSQVRLSVVDNGPGVSVERQNALFAWVESEKSGGMGIGLSISRTIIESQGGRIWLERTSKDGSEFCFTLPRAPKTARTP